MKNEILYQKEVKRLRGLITEALEILREEDNILCRQLYPILLAGAGDGYLAELEMEKTGE